MGTITTKEIMMKRCAWLLFFLPVAPAPAYTLNLPDDAYLPLRLYALQLCDDVVSATDNLKYFRTTPAFADLRTSEGVRSEYRAQIQNLYEVRNKVDSDLLTTSGQVLRNAQIELQAVEALLNFPL
jgi:hypothetical protein